MKLRLIDSAATPVDALPAKGSNTKSPSVVLARRQRVIRAMGFCVGCLPNRFSSRPAVGYRQTVPIRLSPFSAFMSVELKVCLRLFSMCAFVAHRRVSVE